MKNNIISAALLLMFGCTVASAWTATSAITLVDRHEQTIQKLRADIDAHTNLIMVRTALGAREEHHVLIHTGDTALCIEPSERVKHVCDTSNSLAKE